MHVGIGLAEQQHRDLEADAAARHQFGAAEPPRERLHPVRRVGTAADESQRPPLRLPRIRGQFARPVAAFAVQHGALPEARGNRAPNRRQRDRAEARRPIEREPDVFRDLT